MLHALAAGPGSDLPPDVAAVELLNVLRPTVAVAWLGVHAAQAVAEHPAEGRLLSDPDRRTERWHFADEVRRTAPFVPALAGRIRRTTAWHGVLLAPGELVVLDVPGTNHHSRWRDPHCFRPERFADDPPDAFEHVPQGGGSVRSGHRCPGELIAMTLLDRTLLRLARTTFTLSSRGTDPTRIPTRPRALVLRDVQPLDALPRVEVVR
jgi:fatty-acid peroxygenase